MVGRTRLLPLLQADQEPQDFLPGKGKEIPGLVTAGKNLICFVCLLESSEIKVPAYWWCHLSFIPFKEDYKKWKRYVCLESCVPKESTLFFEPKLLDISNCANDLSILGLEVDFSKSRRR